MGYGGHLIWTAALVALQKESAAPLVIAKMPMLSDILAGKLYSREKSYAEDPIFLHNSRYSFAGGERKNIFEKSIDKAFNLLLSFEFIRRVYESGIHKYAESKSIEIGRRYVYLDMRIHSYANRVLSDRILWKSNLRVEEAILSEYKIKALSYSPEMFFLDSERLEAQSILADMGVQTPYIALEPDSNEEYFGSLRSWPMDKWINLVEKLTLQFPGIALVRLGVKSGALEIPGVIDLRGETTFRQAALIISKSFFFIGTEGGLMHAAKAVNAKAVILWGGITLPEFAGYTEAHQIICNYVSCAPCGLLGNCPHGRICMTSIEVNQVLEKVKLIAR